MKQKVLSAILAIVLVTSMIAACAPKESPAPASSAPASSAPASEAPASPAASGKFKVYLITMDLMDSHWKAVDEGAKKSAEAHGIEYKWTAPTNGKDDAAQIECINNAVADGANLILLASNGPTTQVATLKEADAAGVKIIYVDSPAEFPALQTLATNNTNAGKAAGDEMLAKLKADGITSGKIGIVNVNSATTSTVQRENGFREAFKGLDYEILETQYGDGQVDKSQQIATNYITEGCVGIFGTNEGGTVGVGNAIKESGKPCVGVGFDKSDAIMQHIEAGVLLCTMAQNPYDMGFKGMESAFTVLSGGTLSETNVDTGVSVLKKN